MKPAIFYKELLNSIDAYEVADCTCDDVPHYCDWFDKKRELEEFCSGNTEGLKRLLRVWQKVSQAKYDL